MTKIKICGITSLDDAIGAVEAGADILGFNFYPPSPRSISQENCSMITSILKREFPSIPLVGVFVNMAVEQINIISQNCSLDLVQLHGDEPPEMLAAFRGKAFKAFRGIPGDSVFHEYMSFGPGANPAFLLDASAKGFYGGSGETADWSAAAEVARKYSILLAGGLKPGNVAEAVAQVHPWGVDTASGVEESPGTKDIHKMRAFVEEVRSIRPN